MSNLRILVADDSQVMRDAYKEILATGDDFEVVGMASDGEEALEKHTELAPDVIILDVRMPKLDGLAVANKILAGSPQTAIVLVSAYDDLAFVRAIMHSGASRKAYILKNSLADIPEFIRVVEAVAKGQAVLHETIIQSLMDIYHRKIPSDAKPLTDMEESVLKLVLEGYDEIEIAQALGKRIDQVEVLADSLCEKLGLAVQDGPSRSAQVVQAMINICIS